MDVRARTLGPEVREFNQKLPLSRIPLSPCRLTVLDTPQNARNTAQDGAFDDLLHHRPTGLTTGDRGGSSAVWGGWCGRGFLGFFEGVYHGKSELGVPSPRPLPEGRGSFPSSLTALRQPDGTNTAAGTDIPSPFRERVRERAAIRSEVRKPAPPPPATR